MGFAILMYFCLPWSPADARFLNERQKEVARFRLLADGSTATGTKFSFKTFFAPLWDWKFYVFAPIALCYGTAAAVAGNFMTQIIGRFKYSVVKTNLFTVAPFMFGTLLLLITAWSSDRNRERGLHLASSVVLVIIGCVILAALPITEKKASYFAAFLITGGYLEIALWAIPLTEPRRSIHPERPLPHLASMQRPVRRRQSVPSRRIHLPRQRGRHRER
mgnify:CR=1 FL=1